MKEEKQRGISNVFGITAGLIVIFNAFIIALASGNHYLYWTDSNAGTVHRSNLDGTNDVVLVTGLRDPRDVEADVGSSKIYWTDFRGKIQRCNLDGSGIQTLISTYDWPYKMDLDLKNEKMYWTEKTGGFYDMIRRSNLDGSSAEILYTYSTGGGGADGLDLDVDNGFMYLTCTKGTDHIERRNLLGGEAMILTQAGRIPTDIVLDIAGGKMYWATYYYLHNFDGKIKRANLDGTEVQTIVSGLQMPMGIELDLINQKLYWTDMETHKIQYSNLDGTGVTDLMSNSSYEPYGITIAPGLNAPPIAVAGPNQVVYVCDEDELAEVTLDGSGSYDDDNDVLDYYWSWFIEPNYYEANGVSPTIQLPVGEHEIELIVDDGWDLSEPNYCTITVVGPLHAKVLCRPRFLNTQSRRGNIITFVYMPNDVMPEDINGNEPLVFICDSNEVESTRQFVFQRRKHNQPCTWVMAWFDKGDCIDHLSPGMNEIKVTGWLNSGRCYYGESRIYLFEPRSFLRIRR